MIFYDQICYVLLIDNPEVSTLDKSYTINIWYLPLTPLFKYLYNNIPLTQSNEQVVLYNQWAYDDEMIILI